MLMEQPLHEYNGVEHIAPRHLLLTGKPTLEGNRQQSPKDKQSMRMRKPKIVCPLVEVGDAFISRRIVGLDWHLHHGQATPESAHQYFDFKIIALANQFQRREIFQRIGTIAALRIRAIHTRLKHDPEVRECTSKLTRLRHIRHAKIADPQDNRLWAFVNGFFKKRQIRRVMLRIRVKRNHMCKPLILRIRKGRLQCDALSKIARMAKHRGFFTSQQRCHIRICTAVIHDEHRLHPRTTTLNNRQQRLRLVIDRDHA